MKTVVITGANHGIGLELAKVFLANGWRVAALARTAPDLPPAPALRIETADLTDMAVMAGVVERLKGISVDVLINNAGVFDSNDVDGPAADKDFNELTRVYQVNAIIPRLLADALVPNLRASEGKLVVTLTSNMGSYSEINEYNSAHWAYSASKAAVNHAMMSYSLLYPDIKSSLIHPGWVQTDMGGTGALIPAEQAAQNVFDLIANHSAKLPNAKIVDYEGKGLDL